MNSAPIIHTNIYHFIVIIYFVGLCRLLYKADYKLTYKYIRRVQNEDKDNTDDDDDDLIERIKEKLQMEEEEKNRDDSSVDGDDSNEEDDKHDCYGKEGKVQKRSDDTENKVGGE
eukprot:1800553-Ditylum_brightwellii.AAC.1